MDGLEVAGQTVVVTLGITIDGTKVPLGIWLGSTENSRVCTAMLQNLLERGLRIDESILCVVDGGKGIRKALIDVFGDLAVIQRCQLHKLRNLRSYLPKSRHAYVLQTMKEAYKCKSADKARKRLQALVSWLERNGYDEAAGSPSARDYGWAAAYRSAMRRTSATLRINEAEAETVRTLYALYRKHGTLRQVKAEADRLRLRTKQRFAADGTRTGGLPFRRGHLHCLLTNPLYAGRIRHQRRVYEGQHPPIIAPELWDAVQTQLQAGAAKPRRRTTKGRAARSPLAGKLFDETGDRLTPSHTKKKNGQRLRYYVSRRLIQHSGQKDLSGWRLPAPMLEQTVVHLIRQHVDATTFSASLIHTPTMQELASVRRFLDGLCSGTNDDSASVARLLRLIRRVDISPGSVSILLDRNTFAACLSMGPERIREDALRILAPFRLRRRGVETKLVLGNPTKSVDRTLLRNIRNALSWLNRIKAGKTYEEIATEDAIPTDRVRKAIRYAFLAPDIVRAIVEGRQPVGLTSSYLLHHPLPDDWEKQRVLVATL